MEKRVKNKYQRRILEIILAIYSYCYNKMENNKEQYKKQGEQN